ncbi:unnamed protein product [Lactuca virosa]|uniref:Late embryogenesis abundant protein LEA-2 subgroup domain-containing protein n=1 Tax=Lactuca virosa TaxID=75947 RepID=A0AAU9P4F8_9ASTR|nr:unnamed protein product [Lactuca virosa]
MTSRYYPRSSSSSTASIKGCCCCLGLLFSFLALLSLAIILVIVLAIKPKKPQFDLQQVTVQYINFAATNSLTTAVDSPSSASLSLVIRMLFTAKNDNIAGIKYRDSTFNIMYRGVPLGSGHSTRVLPGGSQCEERTDDCVGGSGESVADGCC